jgi:hypothetical protein
MGSHSLVSLPRLLYMGVLCALLIYAEFTDDWLGWLLLVGVVGFVWLMRVSFPLMYRLGQMLGRKKCQERDEMNAVDGSNAVDR